MDDLSVIRFIIKQKLHKHIMKSNKMQSEEIPLTVEAVMDVTVNAWNKIKTSRLEIIVNPIHE